MRTKVKKTRREQIRAFINTFKMSGCEVNGCRETEPTVMDFHHLNPTLKDNALRVAPSNNWSFEKILNEICKCAVICSNCHRKIHAGVIG